MQKFLFLMMILFLISLPVQSAAVDYFIYDNYGGTWHDAEKSVSNSEDDLMCWAGAASNILQWTGWGNVNGFSTEDDIFSHFQAHWTDNGGLPHYGYQWWFSGSHNSPTGSSWAYVDVPGGGAFHTSVNVNDYMKFTTVNSNAMTTIDSYLHDGYGSTIGIYGPGGHAITVWGVQTDDVTGDFLGIYITDSDNNQSSNADTLDYVAVSYNSSDGKWHLQNYYGTSSWYIGYIAGLKGVAGGAQVPEPQTIMFLAIAILSLYSFTRKK